MAALIEAIEEVKIPLHGTAIADAFSQLDRLTARIFDTVDQFDRAGLWALDGASSMTAWLKTHAGRTSTDANQTKKIAKLLHTLPVTAEAFTAGRLTLGQIKVIASNLTEATTGYFANTEADMIPTMKDLTVAETLHVIQVWQREVKAHLPDDIEPPEHENSLNHSTLLGGTSRIDGTLDKETTALVTLALELAETPWQTGEPVRTNAQRRADAFADVFAFFLANHTKPVGKRNRPHLDLIQTVDEFLKFKGASSINANQYDPQRVARLCCDATISRVVMTGSTVLDHGREHRLVDNKLFRTVALADRGCRYPGCDRKPSWTQAHHAIHWETGGPTAFHNLTLLCNRHHHLIHRPGWNLQLLPDRTIIVTTPLGTQLHSRPPNLRLPTS